MLNKLDRIHDYSSKTGLPYWKAAATLITRGLKYTRFFRDDLTPKKLKKLLQSETPVILDIGVATGTEILGWLDVFSSPEIYGFEIDERAIQDFQSVWSNELRTGKLTLVEKAISNTDGMVEFYCSRESYVPKHGYVKNVGVGVRWPWSGSLNKPKIHLEKYNISFDEIPAIVESLRLDSWYKDNIDGKIIDFIWADTNGGEREFILGGFETLQNRVRYLYTEFFDYELYENQVPKKWILDTLTNFEEVKVFGKTDVLLRNKQFSSN